MTNHNLLNSLSPIEEIIEDARNGKMYILIDEADRENEGDLIMPAQMVTSETINFMATWFLINKHTHSMAVDHFTGG